MYKKRKTETNKKQQKTKRGKAVLANEILLFRAARKLAHPSIYKNSNKK